MIGDLHIHTTRSDGSYPPREAVAMAKERGLDFIGIVDHDTTEGLEEALRFGLRLGVLVLPGVEISAYDFKRGRKAHILGYNYSRPARRIKALCDPILHARDGRTREQVAALASAGYRISIEEVEAEAGGAWPLYKQHAMAVLVRKGVADGMYGEFYRRLFGNGGICSGDIRYADAFAALEAIHADGGIAILAHPGLLDSWELLDELIDAGLDGIELYHESHALRDHEKILARKRTAPRLVLTGGSDDHGSLGSVHAMGEIKAPYGALEALDPLPTLPYPFVARLVREAGALLRQAVTKTVLVEAKGGDPRDLVTHYDFLVQEFLVSRISARLPGHSFLAEETEPHSERDADSDPEAEGPIWIIDPIDGTTNFACTGRNFAISIALYEGGSPRLGIVYDVMADELYAAAPGAGAYLGAARLGQAGRAGAIDEAVVDMSMDTVRVLKRFAGTAPEALALAGRGHRALGCASLAICRIARGELDLYVSAKLGPWDYAAADIILAESGGASTVRHLPGEGRDRRDRRFYAAAGNEAVLAGAMDIVFGAAGSSN